MATKLGVFNEISGHLQSCRYYKAEPSPNQVIFVPKPDRNISTVLLGDKIEYYRYIKLKLKESIFIDK